MSYKGKWKPKNISKYSGKIDNITFRSNWERTFFNWADSRPEVVKWCSEEKQCIIPYNNPTKPGAGINARYFCDIYAEIMVNGTRRKFLIEIKPEAETRMPILPKNNNVKSQRRYKAALATFAVNQSKWDAAKKVCNKMGWEFMIFTEHQLSPHSVKKKKRYKT